MYIFDMHCDSILTVTAERGLINKYNFSREYPQLQLIAEFVPRADETAEVRRRRLMHYLDVYIAECARLKLVPVTTCHDLSFAVELEKRASILAVEGGGGLFADSEELNTLYRAGLRVLGLAWDTNELAAGAWDRNDTGLTDEGIALIKRCSELGIILDVSHLSDRSFYQLMEVSAYPVIATHSNFRDICSSPRNLTLDMAQRIASRGGVIGLNIYPGFLRDGGRATKDDILRHVDYALEKLGEDVLAFGFDIDGIEAYPEGIDDTHSIHDQVVDLLLSHYSEGIVEKIAGQNAINFFKCNL